MKGMLRPCKSPLLQQYPSVQHGFFTREGGLSTGEYKSLNCGMVLDDPLARRNRALVAEYFSIASPQLVMLTQVHGCEVKIVGEEKEPRAELTGDALVTTKSKVALGLVTADCAPILLADAHAGVVAAIHAGWRGLAQGILARGIAAMASCGARRDNITASVGPCISQPCYRVGEDVREKFDGNFMTIKSKAEDFFKAASRHSKKWYFNLPACVVAELKALGIGHSAAMNLCTYTGEKQFFSHRRATHQAKKTCGRQISVVMLSTSQEDVP